MHCMKPEDIIKYKNEINETIYACMEMSNQSYIEVCNMPFKRFQDYMSWKVKLQEETNQKIQEEINK